MRILDLKQWLIPEVFVIHIRVFKSRPVAPVHTIQTITTAHLTFSSSQAEASSSNRFGFNKLLPFFFQPRA